MRTGEAEATVAVGVPASPQQIRIRALEERYPSGSYRSRCLVRLDDRVPPEALRAAVEALVNELDVLRTSIVDTGRGGVRQRVETPARYGFAHVDLRRAERLRGQAEMDSWFRRLEGVGDGAERLRALSVLLPSGERRLILDLPAALADGRSVVRLARSIERICAAGGDSGQQGPRYADYARWRLGTLAEKSVEWRSFWERMVARRPSPPALPFEVTEAPPRPPSEAVAVSGKESEVTVLASSSGASREAVALAAWHVLLWRLSEESGPAWSAVSLSGRPFPELTAVVGPCEEYVPLRVDVDPRAGLARLAKDLDGTLHAAREGQQYFDPSIPVGSENEVRTHGHSFRLLERVGRGTAAPAGWRIVHRSSEVDAAGLRLTVPEGGDGRAPWTIDHDPVRHPRREVARLAGRLAKILEEAAVRPERPVGDLEWLPEAEVREIVSLSGTDPGQAPEDTGVPLPERIEELATAAPDRVAAVSAGRWITYGHLHRRAESRARLLRSRGLPTEGRVGVCRGRSEKNIVDIVAIWRAGGCYVPLDPQLPVERLRSMIETAEIRLLLVDRDLEQRLSPAVEATLLVDGRSEEPGSPTHPVVSRTHPKSLAYVIFTSGSTGEPKGVAVEHRHLLRYVGSISNEISVLPGDSFCLASTFAADLGHTVLFPSLALGGCLHVLSETCSLVPRDFAAYLGRQRVDHLKITPSHLAGLLDTGAEPSSLRLRSLILGGEVVGPRLLEVVGRAPAGLRIWNHYGPTETTVGVLAHPVDRHGVVAAGAEPLPIGRPLPHVRVHVADRRLMARPTSTRGEILVGGGSVARGYLGRPARTAERFVPDPFGAEPGARLYRTGDLGRVRQDGALEFHGRIDRQIKVRGHRVELEEIEVLLGRHSAVGQAVVTARSETGGTALHAYVVPAGEPPSPAELRDWLRGHLLEAVLPSTFQVLDALPLTPNGKVDLARLPEPVAAERARFDPPREGLETRIAGLFADILELEQGIDAVGRDNDFFSLGGHSFLAVRLAARIERQLGHRLELRDVLTHPTVANLAGLIASGEPRPSRSLVPLRRGTGAPPVFLVHPAGGTVHGYRALASALPGDRAVYGLQDPRLVDDEWGGAGAGTPRGVEEMAERYLASVVEAWPVGPYLFGGSSFGGVVAFEMARRLQQEGGAVGPVVLIDSRAPTADSRPAETGDAELTVRLCDLLGWHYGIRLEIGIEELRGLKSEQEQLDLVFQRARSLDLLGSDLRVEDFRRFVMAFKDHVRALARYSPAGLYQGDLVLVRAARRTRHGETDREAEVAPAAWRSLTSGAVDVVDVPGDHMTMLDPENAPRVAEAVERALARL